MKIWQSTRNVKSLFYLSFTLLALLLSSFHKSNTYPHPIVPNKEKFVVVLDAGHGGHDPGNLGNGYLEKSIALNIVLKVGEMLEANPDIEVVYTRKDDTFVDLYVRGEIANKANADLFVSVHCDSHTSNAHGAGTFVLGLHANKQNFAIAKKENSVIYLEDDYATRYAEYDINSPESVIGLTIMQEEFLDQSILLAKMMQDNFTKDLKRNDRKVKQAGFIVLHQTFMPSILVETGFLTNTEEGAYLNSKQGQSEMGKAIAEAILDYKKNIAAGVAPEETPQETSSSTPEVPAVPDKKEEVVEVVKAEEPATVVEKPAKVVVNKEEKEEVVKEVEEKIPAVSKPKEVVETPEPVEKPVVESKPEVKEPVPTEVKEVVETPKPAKEPTPVVREVVAKPDPPKEETPKAPKSNVIFKVQILASSKDMALRSDDFGGLNTLSKEPYKNLYRYMYGNTPSFEQAKLLKSNADLKGYTSSYIVAYKDGVRVPLDQVQK